MLFSAFAPFGFYAFSSRPTHAETIFRALKDNVGGNYADGGHEEARLYATAMGLARARYSLERAGNNMLPLKTTELLALREAEYGITPGEIDTLDTRRAVLATRFQLPRGGFLWNLTSLLATLLGSDFLAVVTVAASAAVTFPTTTAGAAINFRLPTEPRRWWKLSGPALGNGGPWWTDYTNQNGTLPAAGQILKPGDVVVVESEASALAERVTVLAEKSSGTTTRQFQATYTLPKDAGASVVSGTHPYWISTKRRLLVVLSASAGIDPVKRARVHALLAEITRGVDTWQIAAGTGPHSAGPFRVAQGRIGFDTIGAITF